MTEQRDSAEPHQSGGAEDSGLHSGAIELGSGEQLAANLSNVGFPKRPSLKFDQNLNGSQKVAFYYSEFRTDQYVTPDGLPSPITALRILYERNPTMRLNYDYTVTPQLLVHAGFGYIMYRNPDEALTSVLTYDAPGQLGLLGGIPNDFTGTTTATGFPRITGLTTSSYGMGLSMGPANANKYAIDEPTAVLNTTYIAGNHSYKVGDLPAGWGFRRRGWAESNLINQRQVVEG